MGGADKAFLKLGGETLIARAIARARPQAGELIINANGDLKRFEGLGCEIIADRIGGFLGPLAGILSGFEWMRRNRPNARWLASFACDCPFFPADNIWNRDISSLPVDPASANTTSPPVCTCKSPLRRLPVTTSDPPVPVFSTPSLMFTDATV